MPLDFSDSLLLKVCIRLSFQIYLLAYQINLQHPPYYYLQSRTSTKMCQMLIINYICPHTRIIDARMSQKTTSISTHASYVKKLIPPIASINLCETKQELARMTKKDSHCEKVSWCELSSDGVCPECSREIFKLEKRYQIVEKYVCRLHSSGRISSSNDKAIRHKHHDYRTR